MSTPTVIVNPQTNNVVITKTNDDQTVVSTYAVNVTSSPSVSIVSVTNNAGISVLLPNFVPQSSTSAGVAGELRWDSNFLYLCVSQNLWKKIPLSNI